MTAFAASARLVCPLGLSYATERSENGESLNRLTIDCLVQREEATVDGDAVRVLSRRSVTIPWTPTVYLAIRNGLADDLRRELNLVAQLRGGRGSSVNVASHGDVRCVYRDIGDYLWEEREGFKLHALTFDSYETRDRASAYLRDNATSRYSSYVLFAVSARDRVTFDVALGTALRARRSIGAPTSARARGIGLREAFAYASWCVCDVERGHYVRLLSDENVRANDLPLDPVLCLPVLTYDIETVANNDNVLPRGVTADQRVAFVAVALNDAFAIVYAHAPVADPRRLAAYQARIDAVFSPRYITVVLVEDERDLLISAIDCLMRNEPIADHYGLRCRDAARDVACVLSGYNVWDYDYGFLVTRLAYLGFHEMVVELSAFSREPRFCRSQISLDAMKHMGARYRAQLGSLALANACRAFGDARDDDADGSDPSDSKRLKMDLDSVSIRRLYYDVRTGESRFDERAALGDLDLATGLNVARIALYNVRDCYATYHLMRNSAMIETTIEYARHFAVPLVDASHVGNSRLFPCAIVFDALDAKNLVVPYRDDRFATVTVRRPKRRRAERDERDLDESSAVKRTRPDRGLERSRDGSESRKRRAFERDDDGASKRARVDESREEDANARRYTPTELLLVADGERADGIGVTCERTVMRIDDKRLFLGGVNSAIPGFYRISHSYDFSGYYPNQGITGDASIETSRVLILRQLRSLFRSLAWADRAVRSGALAVHEYESVDSPFVRRGADLVRHFESPEVEAIVRSDGGHYHGFRFLTWADIERTTRDGRRRLMCVVAVPSCERPIIVDLWIKYLAKRRYYKRMLKSSNLTAVERSSYRCREKMTKVVANSLYGYLGYKGSVVYSPATAALVTLRARKTFHETAWMFENAKPPRLSPERAAVYSCETVYRDTDGTILAPSIRVPSELESARLRVVNARLAKLADARVIPRSNVPDETTGLVRLEPEYENCDLCVVMGRKKYWRAMSDSAEPVSRGFERNAQPYVKSIVRSLQLRVTQLARGPYASFDRYTLCVDRPEIFFHGVFDALSEYRRSNGPESFGFTVPLNPREHSDRSVEGAFIERTLGSFGYDVGDRARCVYRRTVTRDGDPTGAELCLLSDFDRDRDEVNLYKVVRRHATYFLQVVEGKRRSERKGECRITGARFDDLLRRSYASWLTSDDRRDEEARAVFRTLATYDGRPMTDEEMRRATKYLRIMSRHE